MSEKVSFFRPLDRMKILWGRHRGHYELSKDVFVLTVFIDSQKSTNVQCTLDGNSYSTHVIRYLSSKLNLAQSEVFGLRFIASAVNPEARAWRWVDPDQPIRKQLEKHACNPREVHFGIQFYTPNVFALQDFPARTLYFILLKAEVVAGKYTLRGEHFIGLAALSLQAEFGDYDCSVHTLEFLKSFKLLPPHFYRSNQFIDDFLLQILTSYQKLTSVEPHLAALHYIDTVILSADDYGKQLFPARASDSSDVLMGYCRDSLVVQHTHDSALRFLFREITILRAQKKHIIIRCTDDTVVDYQVDDADTARYLVKLFDLQRLFWVKIVPGYLAVPRNARFLDFGNDSAPINYPRMQTPGVSTTSGSNRNPSRKVSIKTPSSTRAVLKKANTPSLPIVLPFDAKDVEHQILRQLLAKKALSSNNINVGGSSPELFTYNATSTKHLPNSCVGRRLTVRLGSLGVSQSCQSTGGGTWLSTPNLASHKISGHHQASTSGSSESRNRQEVFSQGKIVSSSSINRIHGHAITFPVPPPSPRLPIMNPLPPLPLDNIHWLLADLKPPMDSSTEGSSSTPSSDGQTRFTDECISSITTIPSTHSDSYSDRMPSLLFPKLLNGIEHPSPPSSSKHASFFVTNNDNNNTSYHYPNGTTCHNFYQRHESTCSSSNDSRNFNLNSARDDEMDEFDAAKRMSELSTKLATKDALETEFAGIPVKRHSAGTSTSQVPKNQSRIRPHAILPYEETRVALHPTKKNPDGYINASNVRILVNSYVYRFIVAQSPLKTTINDFWTMIWEHGSRIIVMLNSCMNPLISDAPTYWPTKSHEKMVAGNFSIRQQSSSFSSSGTTTILVVKCLPTGEKRLIYHLAFHGFANNKKGVPESVSEFLDFIDGVSSIRRHVESERIASYNAVNASRQNRSRSLSRCSTSDVTSRSRSHSVDRTVHWRKRLNFVSCNETIISHQQNSTSKYNFTPSGTSTRLSIPDSETIHHLPSKNVTTPMVVHCLDGATDSGLFILAELTIRCIEQNVEIEIKKLLYLLRQQRGCLLSSFEQYLFVNKVVLLCLQRSRLI